MARDAQTKIINGHEWKVTPWDGMFGIKMQARIAPLLRGVIAPLANAAAAAKSGDDATEALLGMDAEVIADALFSQIDEQRTPALIKAMMYGAFVDGKDMGTDRNFNEHFSANYGELYQGLWFVLQVNFGDLFSMAAPTGSPSGAVE